MDKLLLTFGPIWRTADNLSKNPLARSDDLRQLKNEAIALDRSFAKWQEAQVEYNKPCTIGHVSQGQAGSKLAVGYWPGKIDTYFDLYLAGVWNISRTARILLIDLIVKLSKILNDSDNQNREHEAAVRLVEDIVSSIPFHLEESLQVFLRDMGNENIKAVINPGRSVGGLLLMHPIYIASKLSIVPQQMREYLEVCLDWIATYMGIGQASLLAKVGVRSYAGKDQGLYHIVGSEHW